MFPEITNEQLMTIINNKLQLRMYNKTTINLFGTCIAEVEHRNNHKKVDIL